LKNKISLLILCVMSAMMAGCMSCTTIRPGYVGVKVDMYGSHRGVQQNTLVTGRVWYNPWTEEVYEFPTFLQYQVWTASANEGKATDESLTFVSSDGIQCNIDVSVGYQFDPDKVPALFVMLHETPEIIGETYIRSKVRDAFARDGAKFPAMSVMGAGIQDIDQAVSNDLNHSLAPIGIHFDYVSIINKPRLPQNIQDAIEAQLETTQRAKAAQNEVAVTKAQAEQAVAKANGQAQAMEAQAQGRAISLLTEKTAEAKANALLAQSITPELLKLRAIDKWSGAVPTYEAGGASPVPFISMDGK
jgi:regulator of protease activity HflC (stomatin/prohibitin superfamily)